MCERQEGPLLYALNAGDEVNFRLTYDGPLRAASQSETRRELKHQMRRVFCKQLIELWATRSNLTPELITSEQKKQRFLHAARTRFKRGEFKCFPLVREDLDLVCDLDIPFLRREIPGQLIGDGGDLDNRLKTLFDALRMPQDDNEVRGFSPGPGEGIFLCLLEDDKLITGFRITTDRLLEPPVSARDTNNVRLVIQVEVKATKVTEENLSYFSHSRGASYAQSWKQNSHPASREAGS